MHQVQVNIVGTEVFEGSIQGLFYIVRVMRVVPELGREEDLVAGDAGLLNCITYGRFSAVDARCVDVAVTGLKSMGDGSAME